MTTDFQALFDKAREAGLAAGRAAIPTPMIVSRVDPVTDRVLETYPPVMDGVCGFAWVTIKGTTPFARWAKKAGLVSKAHPSGYWFWIGDFNQSLTRKEAYARAFAEVLREAGVTAYAGSRMD